ncbi:MAG: PhzF family isomerase [Chloroflexi bacterium]|nr:PhzF family isomerase [Chloroflexota bacterium]
MREYTFYQVDAFTETIFTGNPAGVVPHADGLTEIQMQAIARELNNSETAFLLSATSSDHDVWVRYFTPTREVPICGHATIAAHYVYAVENNIFSTIRVQRTQVGNLPVETVRGNGSYEIIMTQGEIEFFEPFADRMVQRIVNAVGIVPDDIRDDCPIQIVSTGHSKVMVGVKDAAMLDNLAPDFTRLAQISEEIGCNGYFIFAINPPGSATLTTGRMFAPAIGINEDPVTGNANGPLGAYLVKHGLVEHDGQYLDYYGAQGAHINRPGQVHVMVDIEDNQPVKVRVGGRAVIAFKSTFSL